MKKIKDFIEDKVEKVDKFLEDRERKGIEIKQTRKLKEKLERESLKEEAKESKIEMKELKKAEDYKKDIKKLKDYKEKNKKSFIDFGKIGDSIDKNIDFDGYKKRTNDMFNTDDMFKAPKKTGGKKNENNGRFFI